MRAADFGSRLAMTWAADRSFIRRRISVDVATSIPARILAAASGEGDDQTSTLERLLDEIADDMGESLIEALLAAKVPTDDAPIEPVAKTEPESEPVEPEVHSQQGPSETDQRAETASEAELASEEEAAGESAES